MGRKRKRGRPKKRTVSSKTKKTKKKEEPKEKRVYLNIHPETKRGVIIILLFALAVFFILSFQGAGGFLGEYVLKYSKLVFGSGLWLIPLVLIASGIIIFRDIHKNVYLSTLFGIILFLYPQANLLSGKLLKMAFFHNALHALL